MKKKLISLISLVLAAVFGLGMFAGCDLISTDNKRDMEQIVAEVNIGSDEDSLNDMFATIFGGSYALEGDVAENLSSIVTTENVYKRDLVAYFINYGYSYVSSGSYTYAQVFEMMMQSLVSRKIMVQYAMLYYLNEGEVVVDRDSLSEEVLADPEAYGYEVVVDGNGQATDGIRVKGGLTVKDFLGVKNAEGLKGDKQVLEMIGYFLTDDEKNFAEYSLRLAINNAIDEQEKAIITAEGGDTDEEAARTTPTGANQTDDDYYPKDEEGNLYYQIYTGSNYNEDLGEYEKVDGSTPVTRKKAYNAFINSLIRNYLKDESESAADLASLDYYSVELKTQYEQMMINKFSDTLALNMTAQRENADLQSRYNLMYDTQRAKASTGTSSSFTGTMDSMSDSSFVLYSPAAGYGFVYNVLLPFSTSQSNMLTAFKNSNTTAAYLAERNRMAGDILGSDQRASWFTGEEDYSFDAAKEGVSYYDNGGKGTSYLFFKDSYTGGGTGIDRYAGKYPFQGSVSKEDDEYEIVPAEIDIDGFLEELDGYLGYVDKGLSLEGSTEAGFYDRTAQDFILENTAGGIEYDYSQAIYYKGSVLGLGDVTPSSLLAEGSASYNAISAFNDLMFAYSTDTGCLNTYLGYSVAAKGYSTSYVAEFEYAAQEAVAEGTGTVYVVLTDYGWHVIYVSMALPADKVYGEEGFVYDERNTEGTFSYYFYQTMKEEVSASYSSDIQDRIIELLNNDKNVTVYEKRYSDLTSLG